MVYVLNKNGQPLMPTKKHAKVRILLSRGKATVKKRCPFTIQLAYETENFDIRTLDGTKLSAGISYKKLRLLETRKSFLTERRSA